jgi:hypothetical protein
MKINEHMSEMDRVYAVYKQICESKVVNALYEKAMSVPSRDCTIDIGIDFGSCLDHKHIWMCFDDEVHGRYYKYWFSFDEVYDEQYQTDKVIFSDDNRVDEEIWPEDVLHYVIKCLEKFVNDFIA